MLVGDSAVGKTCLLIKYREGSFLSGSFISTIGIDFRVSRLTSYSSHRLLRNILDMLANAKFICKFAFNLVE